jgi:hypothetical protein
LSQVLTRVCSSMVEQRPFKPLVESSSLSTLIKRKSSQAGGFLARR